MSVPGAASPLFLATTGAAEFSIARSLRFNSADSAYLNRTPSSASNRKTWTWSNWVKRSASGAYILFRGGTSSNDSQYFAIQFNANDKLAIGAETLDYLVTTQVFRDFSAWYHIVVALDVNQGTNANKLKLYINGTEVTAFDTDNRSSLSTSDKGVNQTQAHVIGAEPLTSNRYLNGYLAEINFCDGTAYDASSFGQADDNGVWQAKDTAGLTFGTNGFRLKFADNSGATATTLGKDTSGKGNNWTPNNLSVTAGVGNDSLVDSPVNGTASSGGDPGGSIVGNYATMNPLDSNIGSNLTNGNLDAAGSSNWSAGHARATFALTSGKWYWEVTKTGGSATAQIGFCNKAFSLTTSYGSLPADSWTFAFGNGTEILRPSGGGGGYFSGSAMANGDVAGIALDMDAGTAIFYKNGAAGASISLSSTKTGSTNNITELFPLVGVYNANVSFNGGQRAFTHAAPSGYKSLNTANLTPPTITDGSKYFDVALDTGANILSAATSKTDNAGFIWIKDRANNSTNHILFNKVNDVGMDGTPHLRANTTDNEVTCGTYSAPSGNSVGWAWDAGTGNPVTNNDGSIASQVRAQPSAGFSICTYTGNGTGGASIGHELNDVVEFLIVKDRSAAASWHCQHSAIGNTSAIFLNSNSAAVSNSAYWNNTSPTNSVFTVGTADGMNGSGNTYVAYCFASVAGYSQIGSFSPNGTTDNAFVYTGFRTRFILAKFTTPGDWMLLDTSRRPNGPTGGTLIAQDAAAEDGVYNSGQVGFDFLSNGFKIRHNGAPLGDSGKTVIYYAVAENPFQANGGLAR